MTTESTQATATDTTQGGVQAEGAEGVKAGSEGTTSTTAPAAEPAKNPGETTAAAEIKYEFKTPEGVELDKELSDQFTTIAKELKLPADVAQKLVDLHAQGQVKVAEKHAATVADWAAQVKADKELGGDKFAESKVIAMKAVDLGPPELKELLEKSGMGNHPAVFKWAHAVGKALSEDTFKAGNNAPVAERSTASVLYGSTPKN